MSACASPTIQPENLPEEPIAFLHWDDKASKARAKAFASFSELPVHPPPKNDPEGAEDRDIHAFLQGEHSAMFSQILAKNPGRMMVYWPRTGVVERVDAAPINSRPLSWSKDHSRLLFVSGHRDGKRQLYEYDFDRRHLSVLTFGSFEHVRGDYDGEGRLVILQLQASRRGGRPIETVHLASAGGQRERVIARDVHPGALRFTSAGDRIVYEHVRARPRRDGATTFDPFVATRMLEEGATERILVRGREPSLTPDGEWIVFASPSSAGYRLRRMRPDGSSKVAISSGLPQNPGGVNERMPTVSPDGTYVAFIKDSGDRRRLYVRRFDGKRERALLTSGWSEFPVW